MRLLGRILMGKIPMDFIHFRTLVGRMTLCTDIARGFLLLSPSVSTIIVLGLGSSLSIVRLFFNSFLLEVVEDSSSAWISSSGR
jgi:hypothetical protein